MDKNKSRTDLLAAGRKKLQQYRQKKDIKGSTSHGKSSKKSSKSEQHESDVDAIPTTTKSTKSLEVHGEENETPLDSNLGLVNSSDSYFVGNSGASDVDIVAVDPQSIPMTAETSMADQPAISHGNETGKLELGTCENDISSSVPIEEEDKRTVDKEMPGIAFSGSLKIPESEGETKHDEAFARIDVPESHAVADKDGTMITNETQNTHREERKEPLPPVDDTPDMSLVYTMEDQVGVIHEADGLDSKQRDRSCDIERVGDGRISSPKQVEVVETVDGSTLEQTCVEDVASQLKQMDGADNVFASATDMPDRSLASSLNASEVDETLDVHEMTNQRREVNVSPSNAITPNSNILPVYDHCGDEEEDRAVTKVSDQQYMPEESFVFVGENEERPLLTELVKSPPGFVSLLNLSQLTQMIKGLGEEDYRLLLKSRESVSDADVGDACAISVQPGLPDLLERLKEELFLSNCTNNILYLQLTEQSDLQSEYDRRFHQFENEISELHASHKQSLERNHYLADELAECRSELQASIIEKKDLQHQVLAAKAEVKEGSARVYELQNNLERSQSDLSSLSKELAKCKDLVSALQLENEDLNGIIASHTEERKKLMEERDSGLYENVKLLKEIADCKSLVAALQVERSNLNETLAFMTEEKKKLEEEEYHANEHDKFSVELSDCKRMVEALRVENDYLSGNIILVTEEGKKLEEEKDYFVRENERLLSELLVVKDGLSKEHEEHMRSECESRIKVLQSQLQDLQQNSDERVSVLHNQLENFQKEAAERALTIGQEKNSIIVSIVRAVEKLNDSAGILMTSANLTGIHDSMDISNCVAASVNNAVLMIEDLEEKLVAAHIAQETTSILFNEMNGKYKELLVRNEIANDTLLKLYHALQKVVIDSSGTVEESEVKLQDENYPDPTDYTIYRSFMEKMETFLAERLQLQSVNYQLNLELMSRAKIIEELNGRCLDLSSIQKLINDIEGVLKLEDAQMALDKMSVSYLESLVSLLVLEYKEANRLVSSSRENYGSKEMELTEPQEKLHQLTALKLQQENEILLLKERLRQAEEADVAMRSELQDKVNELKQSEQRVSSIREKLSIAVAKGKGLIVQRDNLKQSLAETSSELERCSQELQLKDSRLHEIETKLKAYAEAGERVEALESELSYIRNSATALRESFLLKDSVLQRIEEILEDLDLPEHFHSRDIIEKIDWLARSVTGSSLPPTNWEQKSSVGGLYSDTGFVVTDAWKEDAPSSNSVDDLRIKYEELQNKFYGLAEQNEMLEQSLMERNHLVQRWEELLDRVIMPSQLRSLEPEDRIEWLGSALSEANHDRNSLLQKVDALENYCGSLTADLEESKQRISYLKAELDESQKKISGHESELDEVSHQREILSERLEVLTSDHEKLLTRIVQFEVDKENMQNELAGLQEKLIVKLVKEERMHILDQEISRLQDLICNALQESETEDLISGGSSIECLERLLRRLLENYKTPLAKPIPGDVVEEHHAEATVANPVEEKTSDTVDIVETDAVFIKSERVDSEEPNVDVMRKELAETLSELMYVKEERDRYMEKQRSLVFEVETLNRERAELRELLKQEEQKSNSAREKLNVAVRKGKSLVQQRDGLKQTIEEMNSELERLKIEMKHREDVLADYEQKLKDWSAYSDRVKASEAENELLRNRLAEMDHFLREREHTLTVFFTTLREIDVGGEVYNSDPIEKLKYIGKLCQDLHVAVSSSEQESRKSKRAAELLLAELNEVQDRNDSLLEELAKCNIELQELSKERDIAETVKVETLSHLDKLSMVFSEEKKKQHSEILVLKSAASELRKSFADIHNSLASVFSEDLEFLQSLEAGMKSYLNGTEPNHVVDVPLFSIFDGNTSRNSENKDNFQSLDFLSEAHVLDHANGNFIHEVSGSVQEILKEIGAFKALLYEHSVGLHEQASNLSKLMGIFHREMSSQKDTLEAAFKREINNKGSIVKEKEKEISILRRNFTLLHEACTSSLLEIENIKDKGVRNTPHDRNLQMRTLSNHEFPVGGESVFSSEEHIKLMTERLVLLVEDFASLKDEITEGDKKQMKTTILNLQKELQEKDIQRERISMELVSQIKEAEAAVSRYSLDLQSSNTRVHDLEKQVEVIEKERNLLEQQKMKLQDEQGSLTKLEEKVRSLTGVLASKDQEIEALMQALEEEEVQMDDLTQKIQELENVVRKKNLDIESLEASRGKVLKKLSTTVSKFDELHHFSESLLVEVEKLQSQLQDRDAEISFLRQEVTRSTNDVLVASQMSSKRNLEELQEMLIWLDSLIPPIGMQDVDLDACNQVDAYKEVFQKKITSVLSELEDLRVVAQSRDALLQMERSKVEELKLREAALEKSLHEKESQLNMHDGGSVASEILEVEPLINKWTAPGSSNTSQVRSLRKVNNDQVAIAIDMDPSDSRLEDDDDKVHGFKSLTTSKIVPKFTRPVTDMIDGLWVSCDRALMRQPALRLGIIIYWAILHALLAAFVV